MKSTNNIIAKVQGKFADLVKPVSGAGGPEITPSGSYVRGADVSKEGSDCGCGGSSKAGGSKGGSKTPAKQTASQKATFGPEGSNPNPKLYAGIVENDSGGKPAPAKDYNKGYAKPGSKK